MSNQDTLENFDINGPGIKGNLFGLPYSPDNANVVIVPIPWEVTVSFSTGTASGPQAILEASSQIDLYHRDIANVSKLGVAMLPITGKMQAENNHLRTLAEKHIRSLEQYGQSDVDEILSDQINAACENLNVYVQATCSNLLKAGKLVGVLGGDHSTPLGFMRALSEKFYRFGILQIDAHADLRKSYEGFQYSHGSIMYNALKLSAVDKVVQLGIRDFCEEEAKMIQKSGNRIKTFFDSELKAGFYEGKSWATQCEEIIRELPDLVYISFDIDGLDPKLCPHTGTPVPGGLDFAQIVFLLKQIVMSERKIIGFDLCEVAGDKWDANVGARVLWELCNWMAVSHKRLSVN